MTLRALLLAAALAADPQSEAPEGLPPAPLVSAVALPPGGAAEQPLRRDGESQVDPAVRFRVVAGAPLADARLVLYDAQEALVPAEEQAEIGSTASRHTLSPAKPLRPGSRYTLRLEGASGREIRDLGEKRYKPLSFPLATTGDPPAPPAKKKGKRKRR